ncbi:uncharacterized protein C11orf52 homolog [Sphaerodactylus townsendi]|uniref:uncharacterized protein C11orf52 homolog n=1 Tax=Sphaerodactylus townsendi TaxID=933632 RepID=UPI002026BA07|nr:uncharacterized protein C11orf52 homolog [Sphaerodactylus townsendi]
MGNQCCCRRGWNWPSPFKRKNEKTGSRVSKPSPQHPESKQGFDVTPVYDDVSEFPVYATVTKPKHTKRDNSNVHYADIQVFSKIRERSAEEVKTLQSQNATEYATLNFPRATPKYDSKNGTLV